MCYINIQPATLPKQSHYWKVVFVHKGEYYGVYTKELLKKGQWNISKNVTKEDRSLPLSLIKDNYCRGHSYESNFKGFGVFKTRKQARSYRRWHFSMDKPYKTIKATVRGNHRVAQSSVPGCHIFNQIKVLEN